MWLDSGRYRYQALQTGTFPLSALAGSCFASKPDCKLLPTLEQVSSTGLIQQVCLGHATVLSSPPPHLQVGQCGQPCHEFPCRISSCNIYTFQPCWSLGSFTATSGLIQTPKCTVLCCRPCRRLSQLVAVCSSHRNSRRLHSSTHTSAQLCASLHCQQSPISCQALHPQQQQQQQA